MSSPGPGKTMTDVTATVHVHRGRKQHAVNDDPRRGYWTRCGRVWAARNIGPPATEKPLCQVCFPGEGQDPGRTDDDG